MKHNRFILILFISSILHLSCKKFLEIDPPKNSLVRETVFQNDVQATAAINGIYGVWVSSGFTYVLGSNSVTFLGGLSADELTGHSSANLPFNQNQLNPLTSQLSILYGGPYQSIYTANSILEGLLQSTGVTPPVKAQLEGEALFIRAFAYFYLVNTFGEIPLHLTTDYRVTEKAIRSPVNLIYQQIVKDLKSAESLLSESYPSMGRVRVNRSVVQALLARTYLYMQNWEEAEKYSSLIIAKTGTYGLSSLDGIFLANSQEAIWQLMPPLNSNTIDGSRFILQDTPSDISLSSEFVANAFEPNDKRKESWVRSFSNNTGTYYYPFKYKVKSSTAVTEYSMVFRLAEQYLIRAEARINQSSRIAEGIADLNTIRARARSAATITVPNPLPILSVNLNKSDALLAVEQERRVELFSEWGHRWYDLKRTGRANSVLALVKPQWQITDVLFPIPNDEIARNPNIKQNAGY
jgi:hypothetical protein